MKIRKPHNLGFAAIVALSFLAAEVSAKHLFILSGQSNMARFKPVKVFQPALDAEFGKENIIIVKEAKGGQPILRWYKDWKSAADEKPESTGDIYDSMMVKVKEAIKGEELSSITFIWMQGEADAKASNGAVYAVSLEGVINQLRADLKCKEINLVCGRISDFDMDNKKYPHWTMVRDAQVALADANPRYDWVDTDDLNDGASKDGRVRPNALHYSIEGYKIIGQRYADKAIALIKDNPTN
jgi:hypothetical protein